MRLALISDIHGNLDALEAVAARSREMAAVSVDDPGLLAAVFGPLGQVEEILEKIGGDVIVANANSNGQCDDCET